MRILRHFRKHFRPTESTLSDGGRAQRGRMQSPWARRLQLECLEDRTVPDITFSNFANNVVDPHLASLENGLASIAKTTANLPVINSKLQSLTNGTTDALNQFRSTLKTILASLDSSASESALQNALYPQLDASGFLHDLNGNGTADDRLLTKAGGEITISMNVGLDRSVPGFQFGLGLPGLPLTVRSGPMQVTAGFAYDGLTFGLQTGYQNVGTLSATVNASLGAGTTIRGTLGFLEVSATVPDPNTSKPYYAGPTGLSLTFATDVTNAGLANPRLSGSADVNLDLKADFTGNNVQQGYKYPNIRSNLYMHWGFNNANPAADRSSFGDEPDVQFRSVQFGMGTFLSEVLRPIVNTVQDVTKPLKPILDILSAELPGISDISTAAGLPPVSIESLAKLAESTGFLPPDYQLLLDVALTSIDLIRIIDNIPKGTEVLVPVGTFSLAGNNIRARNAIDFANGLNSANLTDLIPQAIGAITKIEDAVPSAFKPVFDFINNKLKSAQNGVGIDFPLLKDPRTGVFKLLLGQDVDFVNFIARFHLGASYTQLVPLWGPVSVRFDGRIDADAYFKMGYDTYGLRKYLQGLLSGKPNGGDLVAGLYFDSSKDLLRMSGSLSAGLAAGIVFPTINIPVPFPPFDVPVTVDASVNGSISAEDVSVRFGTADSKLRFLVAKAEPLFQTEGLIKGGFDFVVEAGVPGVYMQELYKKTITETTLLDLYNGPLANPANPVNIVPPVPDKVAVTLDLSGLPQRIVTVGGLPRVVPDLISIDVQTLQLPAILGGPKQVVNFLVNGQEWPAAPPLPLDQLKSVRIIGSQSSDRLTVDGAVNRPVSFEATPGQLNTLVLDDTDSRPGFVDNYTVTGGAADGDLLRRANRGIFSDTVDVRYSNVGFVTLKASNSSPNNFVAISDLFNSQLTVQLGATNNNVSLDLTHGGYGDVVSIVAAPGHKGVNSLTIFDQDPAIGLGASTPTTYTLSTTFAYNPNTFNRQVVDERVVREKRLVATLGKRLQTVSYTATTTVSYAGIDNLAINGNGRGNLFKVQGVNDKMSYALAGGDGNDTFLLSPDSHHLGFANARISMDGGGGRDDRLVLDDSANDGVTYNPVSTYTVTGSRITYQEQMGPTAVSGRYDFGNIEHLTIQSGGYSTFIVNDTPQVVNLDGTGGIKGTHFDGDTTIVGGKNFDSVYVRRTSGLLTLGNGVDNATLGNNSGQADGVLDQIRAPVTVQGQDPVNVFITDTLNTLANIYVMDAGQFVRRDAAGNATMGVITYRDARLGTLSIFGGSGGNTFRINDTPLTYGFTFGSPGVGINAGAGGDAVFVRGTTGPVGIDMGQGLRQSITVGDASTSLDAIRGDVLVSGGAGIITGTVTDQATTTGRTVQIDANRFGAQTITRYGNPAIDPTKKVKITFGLFGRVLSNLTFTAGAGTNSISVNGTAAGSNLVINGGPGPNEGIFLVAEQNALNGPINLHLQSSAGDLVEYFDTNNTASQTYTVTANSIRRSGQADIIYDGAFALFVFEPTVGGNSTSIQGVAAGSLVKTINSNGDQVVIGSRAPNTGGSVQGILDTVEVTTNDPNARVSVLVDDSADANTTARRVEFAKDSEDQINMVGLAPLSASIAWRLTPESSVRVLGGPADETFFVQPVVSETPLSIDGGGGVNTLDYSGYDGLPGLVSWYPGDGSAVDATGGSNGTSHGDVLFLPGKVGQAFGFNGANAYVQIPTDNSLDTPSVSVEAWVNSTTLGRNKYIVSKGADGDHAASYALYTAETGLRFYVYDGATFSESPDPGPGIWDGGWHHVVGTYDGANVRLYVDGAEVGSGTPANLRINYGLPTSNDLFIGTYGTTNSIYAFGGLVDEPSIYNLALTAAEVQQLYAAGSGGKSVVAHGVAVDLPLGTATALTGGVTHIQNVTGSAFNDILVGNGGNVLDGGGGRNLLIAGGSASTLLGGSGEDILIAGTTTYDANLAALTDILAVWSGGSSYADRVSRLVDDPGYAFSLNERTVHSNGGGNKLTGKKGGAATMDLYFANIAAGDLLDATPDDRLVAIA